MIASTYIKDGNIHLYNEKNSINAVGGLAYELGRPLLDFVCYEPELFDDGFSAITEALNDDFAHEGIKDPAFITELEIQMKEFQTKEIYVFFYYQQFINFIYTFIESPQAAITQLDEKIPGAKEGLNWAMNFHWHNLSQSHPDKERRLFRAAKDVVTFMSDNIRKNIEAMSCEVQLLINFRTVMGKPKKSSLEYLYWLEQFRLEKYGYYFYLENPFHTFYGTLPSQEVVQLYEMNTVTDLFRFEFIKMIEHDIFIKKCANCNRFFIPRGRTDTEYCTRLWNDGPRRCNEIGATLKYEKKVATNPILEAHKKAYRRFNSRTRTKKMTQSEFLNWSEEAGKKRDACLAGELPFEDYIAWLEQGRIRKSRV
jgi:hypothetical protein